MLPDALGAHGSKHQEAMRVVPPATLEQLIGSASCASEGLVPLLHHLQDALGYVPPDAVPLIAKACSVSQADVHDAIASDFRTQPPGRHVVRLCRAESCQAAGADALAAHAQTRCGIGLGQTTADGAVTLEAVHCLGLCSAGPALMFDERDVRGRVTPDAFDALLTELRKPG